MNELTSQILSEFPTFSIVKKSDSWFMKLINVLLLIISFGQMKRFMTDYITTIGFTTYVPSTWDSISEDEQYIVLSHEHMHMLQYNKYGFFFGFLYLVVLPTIFTYRSVFERQAYEISIRLTYLASGKNIDFIKGDYKAFILSQFTTSAYLWMDIRTSSLNAWYDGIVATLK